MCTIHYCEHSLHVSVLFTAKQEPRGSVNEFINCLLYPLHHILCSPFSFLLRRPYSHMCSARNMIYREKRRDLVTFPLRGLDLTSRNLAGSAAHQSASNSSSSSSAAISPPSTLLYDCVAVINHMGNMSGGHYTAYVNHDVARCDEGAAQDPGQWYCCDDSSVYPEDADKVVSPAAYVLVYKKRKIVAKI